MTTSTQASSGLDPEAKIRCSDWTRAASLSPIGTSGSYAGYLLVEIPLPWPRDAGDTAEGAAVAPLIGPLRYRLQAVAPAGPDPGPSERRVILHARRPGETGFSGYRRFSSRAGDSLADTVAALIAAAAGDSHSELESPAVDLLVCTHGTRDSCCGKRGASSRSSWRRLPGWPASTSGAPATWAATGSRRPSWCCRRAPPGASPTPAWSPGSVHRAGDFADAAGHYRGCPGLDSPQVQALEAEVLRRVGWSLLDTTAHRLVRWKERAVDLGGRRTDGHLDSRRPPRPHHPRAGMHGAAVSRQQERNGMGRHRGAPPLGPAL